MGCTRNSNSNKVHGMAHTRAIRRSNSISSRILIMASTVIENATETGMIGMDRAAGVASVVVAEEPVEVAVILRVKADAYAISMLKEGKQI